MNIAHVVGGFKLPQAPEEGEMSGVVRAALEVAQAQVRRGHRVTLVGVGDESWERTWQEITLTQLKTTPWARARLGRRTLDFQVHASLVRFFRARRFDVVQGHLYYYLRFIKARVRIAHFHASPFYEAHGESATPSKLADFGVIAGCSHAQVAVSHFIAAQIERGMALSGNPANVHTVHNGAPHGRGALADARTEARGALRRELGIPEEATLFLFVGAVVPEKGVAQLAQAFAEVAGEDPRAQLVVAGSASLWDMATGDNPARGYEQEVAARLRPLALAGRVHLLGAVKSCLMPRLYAASDVVVIPSVWPEPFPLVALEALAAGKPVIASHVGGLPEAIDQACGMLVLPGDESALAKAMHSLSRCPERRRDLGLGALEAARRFSWETAARQLEGIYEAVLERRA